jgi:acetyl esterase
MPLDPHAAAYLAQVEALNVPPISDETVEEARQLMENGTAVFAGSGDDVRVEDGVIQGVPVRTYTPHGNGPWPVLVWFHGGGWVIGSVRTHDVPCRALASRANCRVVSVEYRLAPEHRFPAALEDAWTVTRAIVAEHDQVAVGGDSAGGNLAAAVALRARDQGLPLALQLLIYPATDCDFTRPSVQAYATGYGLTRGTMRWFWNQYLGDTPADHPEAAVIRAADLRGLAPALVLVCEYDVLHDEGIAYADALQAAGVPVQVVEEPGMIHGFFRIPAAIPRAKIAHDVCAAALRKAFTG